MNMAVIKKTLGEKRRSVPQPTRLETLIKQENHINNRMFTCKRIIELQNEALKEYEAELSEVRMEIEEEQEKERKENART